MITVTRLVLASQSPHRQQLLNRMGIDFETVPAHGFNEEDIVARIPEDLALARARGKAHYVAARNPGKLVIGSDQVLDIEGESLGKAKDVSEARLRLQRLSGKTHHLRNGLVIALLQEDKVYEIFAGVISVPMTMRPLSMAEIDAYLETQEWMGCAGCYRIEGKGLFLFAAVTGAEPDIIGLPILSLYEQLRVVGMDLLLHPKGPWTLNLPQPAR
jgi:septum formation protein